MDDVGAKVVELEFATLNTNVLLYEAAHRSAAQGGAIVEMAGCGQN